MKHALIHKIGHSYHAEMGHDDGFNGVRSVRTPVALIPSPTLPSFSAIRAQPNDKARKTTSDVHSQQGILPYDIMDKVLWSVCGRTYPQTRASNRGAGAGTAPASPQPLADTHDHVHISSISRKLTQERTHVLTEKHSTIDRTRPHTNALAIVRFA